MFFSLRKMSKMRHILITGCNEGIGFQTALLLAAQNNRIIMADKADLAEAKQTIIEKSCNSNISTKHLDLASLSSVRKFCKEIQAEEKEIHVLINNAGVFCLGKNRTVDGLQATMQVNHFAPFLLTHLLTDLLVKSGPSRVIFLSSLGAFFHKLTVDNINNPDVAFLDALSSLLVYYNSKLCVMIAANIFAEKLKNSGVCVNSVHPGMTGTNFLTKSKVKNFFLQDPAMGAQSSVFLATSPHVDKVSGKFFVEMREHQQPTVTCNGDFCRAIWEASECFVGLEKDERISV